MSQTAIYYRGNTGARASCASELGYRARLATINTAVTLIQKVVEREQCVFNELFGRSALETGRLQQLEMVGANILGAVRVFTVKEGCR